MLKDASFAALPDPCRRAPRPSEFERIRRLAHDESGLDLKRGKEGLVSARLAKAMRRGGFATFESYCDHVLGDSGGEALEEMIDALTTHHTSFFREPSHFDFLAAAAQAEFHDAATLRIWSAACSTGEEAYSIAFHLLRAGLAPAGFRILASDISTRALATARQGVYAAEDLEQMPESWRRRFLLRGVGAWQGYYKIKREVADAIAFRRLNLIDPFPAARPYHFIFCRNVTMYFDRAMQADVVNRLASRLAPGGYLFTGHSESLSGIEHPLAYCGPAMYRNMEQRRPGRDL